MSPAPAAPPATSSARRELLALMALGLLTFAAAWRFALFDRLVETARRLEGLPFDALLVAILVLMPALGLYAWRRWHEVRHELAARIAAEAALHAREAQLGLLTRQLPAFLWTTDADLRLTMFAGGGFRRGDIDPRGRVGLTIAEFFGVDDPAFPPLAAHQSALDGEPAGYPLHRDGRDYEVRVEPLRDATGRIIGTLGLGVDVTERAHAAASLRESEARFRAVVEQAAEGVFLFEAEGKRLLEANPALLRLLGYDPADLPTLTLYDIVAHDRASVDANTAHLLRAGRNLIGERDYRCRDGAAVPVEVSATALGATGGATLCVVVRDLTARRAAEVALGESDRLLREAVDHAPLILFTLDRAGVVTFARGQALEALGLTARQVVGHSIFIEGQEFPEVPDNVRRALAGEAFDAAVDIGRYSFSVHYAPLHDDGAIAGVIGVAVNITRRRRAEATVRRYAAGLTLHEQEVLDLLATDLTQRQIATRLCIGHETVRTHLRRIAAKIDLGTAGRATVVAATREQGLLGTAEPEP